MSFAKIDAVLKTLNECCKDQQAAEADLKYADLVVYTGPGRDHKGPYFVKGEKNGKLMLVEPESGEQFLADPGDVEDYLAHYKSKFKIDMSRK